MINGLLKKCLQLLGIYHPLQSFYRGRLDENRKTKYREAFQQYAGSGFQCNVCHAKYEKFVADYPAPENKSALETNQVIAGYGENIICPNCLSNARERLVLAFLQHRYDVNGKKILQLSPEKNIFNYLRQRAAVITADLDPGFYRSIDPRIEKQDARALQYKSGEFDLVIANHVLEHIPDDSQAMEEIFRVLKPGGMAILQVPYGEALENTIEEPMIHNPARQSALFGQRDHVRIYALKDYVQKLREAGFNVVILADNDLETFRQFAIQPGEKFLSIVKPAAG